MGWFWSSGSEKSSERSSDKLDPSVVQHIQAEVNNSKCPVDHRALAEPAASKCPVDHTKLMAKVKSQSEETSKCPVEPSKRSWWFSKNNDEINPLNMMPDLKNQKVPGQKLDLPTERTFSSIPKGEKDADGVWEYPSPQQMLNAMLRKGGGEVPEDAVESMVDVHNFLNEGAWQEILQWEQPYTQRAGSETPARQPRLLKFQGRPNDLSPRAHMLQVLGRIYPSKYGTQAPFDRHDWTVLRPVDNGDWQKVRYVIDYYAGPDTEDGMPSFILDVRPALDSVQAGVDRFNKVTNNAWARAMGWEK